MTNSSTYTVYSLSKTLSDNAEPITTENITLDDCNIHVYDYDAYYGNGIYQDAKVTADSVLSYRHLNLREFFMKNVTAGSNSRIVVVGTLKVS